MLVIPEEKAWQPQVILDIANKKEQSASLATEAIQVAPKQALHDRISELTKNVARIPPMEKELEMAREADTKGLVLKEKIKDATSRVERLVEESGKIAIPNKPDLDGLNKERESLERDAGACRMALDNLLIETGQQEAKIEENNKKAEELLLLEKKIMEQVSQVEAKIELVKAFGRDGIPQLIVDGAIPRFQDLTSGLLGAFDGRWSISIRSQRKTAKGTDMKEVVDILVHDGFAERDISTYSGGERQVLKTVIRIAFATLQAERSGKGLKVMVLDEATDKMETTLSVPYINMLSMISDAFNQVFVVSHAEHVLSAMPNKVLLSLEDDATKAMLVT
jgi:DNA repair exonuclease SbcCD ATPase subunit